MTLRPGSEWAAAYALNGLSFVNLRTRQRAGTFLQLSPAVYAYLSPEGYIKASGPYDQLLIFIAETNDGKLLTLTPREFASRFGWSNNPAKARVVFADPR